MKRQHSGVWGREAKIQPGRTAEFKRNFQTELLSFPAKSLLAVVTLAVCLIMNTLLLFEGSLLNVSFPVLFITFLQLPLISKQDSLEL